MIRILPKDVGLKFPRTIGKRKAEPRDPTSEATIQGLVEAYLRALGVPYIRIPDAAYRAIFAGAASVGTKREAAEYLRGLPDLIILYRGKFLALELKKDGGKLTGHQRIWRDAIGTKVAMSFEAARGLIDGFMRGAA
jgi:hypothetical protein